jgi:hypothetical protein
MIMINAYVKREDRLRGSSVTGYVLGLCKTLGSIPIEHRAGRMIQVVELLPRKCGTFGGTNSNPSTTKKMPSMLKTKTKSNIRVFCVKSY